MKNAFQALVENELGRARSKFPRPQASRHEGLAVLEEEVHEVRTNVYTDAPNVQTLKELVQVAAMAQRMAEETLPFEELIHDIESSERAP
jgi:hypothetical protein